MRIYNLLEEQLKKMIENCSPLTDSIIRDADKLIQEGNQPYVTTLEIFYFIFKYKSKVTDDILKPYQILSKDKFNKFRATKKELIEEWSKRRFKYNKQRRLNPTEFGNLPFSDNAKKMLSVALYIMLVFDSPTLEPEHILFAISLDSKKSTFAAQFLIYEGFSLEKLYKELLRRMPGNKNVVFSKQMYKKPQHIFIDTQVVELKATSKIFTDYTINITKKAKENLLDYIVGRNEEVSQVMGVLLRRKKNNCILIGEPGVGKTAIIEALAQRVNDHTVPLKIGDLEILQLDMNSMIAGTRFRGEFEERFKNLIKALQTFSNFVLVIDEIHKIIRVSGSDGALDAANMLKPPLSRGEFKCIGTTTNAEYRKTIQKDIAFDRRFQPINILEPSIETSIEILYYISDRLQEYHNISISVPAINASVNFSQQYINDRFLPDKAIDLLDEACTYVLSQGVIKTEITPEVQIELDKICYCKNRCIDFQDFREAARYRTLEKEIREQIQMHSKFYRDAYKKKTYLFQVEENDVAEVITMWTGIPINKLSKDETARLLNMENILHEKVIGQDVAVSAISNAIRRARVGLKNPNRPIASFIFAGPTGVGKTELVKTLAFFFFGSENAMVRLDMSEYMERQNISKLIGSPPGYIGYEEGGFLTEKVRSKPYTVVLFDEIEKAHPDVFNLLLQILEDGRLTDSKNHLIDFKNTLIILTSNIGSTAIQKETEKQNSNRLLLDEKTRYNQMVAVVQEELKRNFRPEFLNRLDEIIVFQQLTLPEVRKITDILLKQLTNRILEQSKLLIHIFDEVKEKLSVAGFSPLYGARPLRRVIMNLIEDRLSTLVLENAYRPGTILTICLDDEQNIEVLVTGFAPSLSKDFYSKTQDKFDLQGKNPVKDSDIIIENSVIYLKGFGFDFRKAI